MPLIAVKLQDLKDKYAQWCEVHRGYESREQGYFRLGRRSAEVRLARQKTDAMYNKLVGILKESGFNLEGYPLNLRIGHVRLLEALSRIDENEVHLADKLAQNKALLDTACALGRYGNKLTLAQLCEEPQEVIKLIGLPSVRDFLFRRANELFFEQDKLKLTADDMLVLARTNKAFRQVIKKDSISIDDVFTAYRPFRLERLQDIQEAYKNWKNASEREKQSKWENIQNQLMQAGLNAAYIAAYHGIDDPSQTHVFDNNGGRYLDRMFAKQKFIRFLDVLMDINESEIEYVKPLFNNPNGFVAMCLLRAMGSDVKLAELHADENLRKFIASDKIQKFLEEQIERPTTDINPRLTRNKKIINDIVATFKNTPEFASAVADAKEDELIEVLADYTGNESLKRMLYDQSRVCSTSTGLTDTDSFTGEEYVMSDGEIEEANRRDNPQHEATERQSLPEDEDTAFFRLLETPISRVDAANVISLASGMMTSESVVKPIESKQSLLDVFKKEYEQPLDLAHRVAQNPSEFDEHIQRFVRQRIFGLHFLEALTHDRHFNFKLLGRYGDNPHGFSKKVSRFAAVILYPQDAQNSPAFIVDLGNTAQIGLQDRSGKTGRMLGWNQGEDFAAPLSDIGTIILSFSGDENAVEVDKLLGFTPMQTVSETVAGQLRVLTNQAILAAKQQANTLFEDFITDEVLCQSMLPTRNFSLREVGASSTRPALCFAKPNEEVCTSET